jgi:hypothetical protein
MTIDPVELVNLDVTIAEFIIPRLEAFRAATDSYPADLDDMGLWHAELDEMVDALKLIVTQDEPRLGSTIPYTPSHQAGLDLFAKRFGDLWQ